MIEVKKVAEEWEIWEKEEEIARSEEEVKKMVPERFHQWIKVFGKCYGTLWTLTFFFFFYLFFLILYFFSFEFLFLFLFINNEEAHNIAVT